MRFAWPSSFRNSSAIRSALTTVSCGAIALMAARVAGSIARSKRAAIRTARSSRSLSSVNRATGSPMARSTFAAKSARPPT